MKLKLYELTQEKYLLSLPTEALSADWVRDRATQWLDVDEAESDELAPLLTPLDLHPLVLEDCLNPHRSSLIDRYDRTLYLEFPSSEAEEPQERPFLSILCLPSKLITIHRGSLSSLNALARKLSGDIRLYDDHKEALLYHILDHFIDQNVLHIIGARNKIDHLFDILNDDPDSLEIEDIQALKRRVGRLASIAEDHLYCVTALQTVETRAFSIGRQREYFRDLVSNAEQAIRFTNRLDERLKDLHESYQLTLHGRSEGRLRVLTIISAVFLPLTLISSIYGMNFEYMPELARPYGYPAVLGVMVVLAFGMIAYLYRRGWFE